MKKKRRIITTNHHGVTEIVGTMLLLAISIALFSVVYYSVLSAPEPVSTPSAQIIGSLDVRNNRIVFHHAGGEPIDGDGKILIHKGNIANEEQISTYVGEEWEMGETIIYPIYNINDTYVDAVIIDTNSNSIVSNAILQKGYSMTDPYVETLPATDIEKRSVKLNMRYDFVTTSGFIYFSYREEGESSWTNMTKVAKSGYATIWSPLDNLEMDTTYEYQGVIEYDSTVLTGGIEQFTTSSPSLETSVDDIPDTISTSPYPLNATGDEDLDNVTLYYRYSTDGGATWESGGSGLNWWDDDWLYRKPLNVSVASGITSNNFAVKTRILYESSMNSDFSDLRFIDYSDNSTEFYYWIENKDNGNWADVWIQFNDPIGTTSKTVAFMYYGNTTATYTGSASNVFTYYFNFSGRTPDGDMDGQDGTATYTVEDNGRTLHLEENGWKYYTDWSITFSSGDYILEVNMSSIESGELIGLGIHSGDDINEDRTYIFDGTQTNWGSDPDQTYTEGSGWNTVYTILDDFSASNDNLVICNDADDPPETDWRIKDLRIRPYHSSGPTITFADETGGNGWTKYDIDENPDVDHPWEWDFEFGEQLGYYEFLSIGQYKNNLEPWPEIADQNCTYTTD